MPHPFKSRKKPLWHWVGIRMSMLAVSAVSAIAFGMWLHFFLSNWAMLSKVPPQVRDEFLRLQTVPQANEARLWQLLAQYYPIENLLPGIATKDWVLLAVFVAGAIPIIILCGFLFSRSLSSQFSSIAQVARLVAQGDFQTRLPPNTNAPDELQCLIRDFNSMTIQLGRYEQEVRESSAVIAHELRTPLTAAMGRVQGMMDDVFPRDVNQLQMVKRQLDQLSKLVDDLHLLSLARAGQLVIGKTKFSLHNLVLERLAWFKTALDETGIAHHVRIPSNLHLLADKDRMGQVLSILIDNFIRYASQGGELDISARIVEQKLLLVFADRGPGIEVEDLHYVFERFWRAERSRARHSGGSGLGLSIARAICLAHGADINVSNREGGGALIEIAIPLADVGFS